MWLHSARWWLVAACRHGGPMITQQQRGAAFCNVFCDLSSFSTSSNARVHHQQRCWGAPAVHNPGMHARHYVGLPATDEPTNSSMHMSQQVQQQHHARPLDGRAVAAAWQRELAADVPALTQALGRPPALAVIVVGQRPDSLLYVSRKLEACTQVGIQAMLHRLPGTVRQEQLIARVKTLCEDPKIDGVLVQLPLPAHINEDEVINVLDPCKDVDGFHPVNVGRLMQRGRHARFVACTALGAVELLQRSGIELQGKTAVVVGDSNVVGLPLAMLLREHNVAAVTICHRTALEELYAPTNADACHATAQHRAEVGVCLPRLPGPRAAPRGDPGVSHAPVPTTVHAAVQATACSDAAAAAAASLQHRLQLDLPAITRTADILVVAVGIPKLVKADWVRPGAVIVDVGINVVQGRELFECCPAGERPAEYSVVGDVDYDDVAPVASAVTPVPGGIGPMTIAAVLHNVLQSARGVV